MPGSLLFILAFFFHFKFYEAVRCNFSNDCAQDGTKVVHITLEIEKDLRIQQNAFSVHWYGLENAPLENAKMVLDVKWFHDSSPNFVCALHLANMSECRLSGNGTVVQATIRHPSSALEGKYKLQKVGYVDDQAICYLNLSLHNYLENCKYAEIKDSSGPATLFIISCSLGVGVGVMAGVIVCCYCCLRKRRPLSRSCLAHCCPCRQVCQNLNGSVHTSNTRLEETHKKVIEELKARPSRPAGVTDHRPVEAAIIIDVEDTSGDIGTAAVGYKPEMLSRSSSDQLPGVEVTPKVNGPPEGQGGEGTRDIEAVVEVSVADNDQEAGDEGDQCQQEEGDEEVRGEGEEKYRQPNQDNDNDNELGDVEEGESRQALLTSSEEVNPTEISSLL